jgi:hypothetical protein
MSTDKTATLTKFTMHQAAGDAEAQGSQPSGEKWLPQLSGTTGLYSTYCISISTF